MLIAILWPATALFALFLGYWARSMILAIQRLAVRLDDLEKRKEEQETKPIAEEAKSVIIDPTDLDQQVKMEQEEMMRKLNPEMYDDLHEL